MQLNPADKLVFDFSRKG